MKLKMKFKTELLNKVDVDGDQLLSMMIKDDDREMEIDELVYLIDMLKKRMMSKYDII